jgi:8-oxo-dGTP pyrophosphatase MutT (NUDIX family)
MSGVETSGRRTDLLDALADYRPESAREAAILARFLAFLDRSDPFFREDPAGHVTASAIVARPRGDLFLLVSHRKLGGWLQPGGHVEPDDSSVFEAALREVREETGLERLESPLGDSILDLDVHPIPAFGEDPPHLHYDVRFLLTSDEDNVRAPGAAWFVLNAVSRVDRDGSLDRAVRKAVSRLAAR